MKKTFLSLFCFLLAAALTAGEDAVQVVSWESLMKELASRDVLCEFPDPAFTCAQFSSYDRGAKNPDENWFANADASQFLRVEKNANADGREEWVLMDAQGPGAVVRFWITAPHYKCNLYVYIDGAAEPTISGNIADIIGGTALADGPLSAETARGRNLYLPIPYAKSIKVTVDQMPVQNNLYYQINYRTYVPDTRMESFSMREWKQSEEFINRIQKMLSEPVSGEGVGTLPRGSHCIRRMGVRAEVENPDQLAAVMRSHAVKMTFDGRETVWCPLGDFFGSGVGANPYRTFYTLVEKNESGTVCEMICRWPMPYRESAVVEVESLSGLPAKIRIEPFLVSEYEWKDGRSMYFHCDWRQERQIETLGGQGTKDWRYATLEGKGVYAGDCLSVLNRNPAWWGEGDEKIYVDGEKFPSHFGTGTEDYYGYAWCTPRFFESPWRAQPRAEGPSNFGHTTNLRFRGLDRIPFRSRLQFDMEVWHWAATKIDYAVAVFWYGLPDAVMADAPSLERRAEEARSPVSYKTVMELKFGTFKVVGNPSGRAEIQGMKNFKLGQWRDDKQLWWIHTTPGDTLKLEVNVPDGGAKTLILGLTQAVDYGRFAFFLDGQPLGQPCDLYVPRESGVLHTKLEIPCEISAGLHTLTVEVLPKNPESIGTMFGMDYAEFD